MLNRVSIIGNLGADPEVRRLQSGKPVVNFRVAVSEKWKDANGERQEKTEWVPVVIFNEGLCGVAEKYLHKGSKVFVEGKFATRRWQDQSGADKYSTEIVLQGFNGNLTMLDGPGERSEGERQSGGSSYDQREPRGGAGADLSDDIPFGPEVRI